MKNDLLREKFFLPLFIFPLIYIIGIAVVEVFLFLYLIFLFLNINNVESLNKKILIILFLLIKYVSLKML